MPRLTPLRVRSALVVVLLAGPGLVFLHGQDKKPAAKTQLAWTLDEAMEQLELHPRDPYLQYVAMQLARRKKDVNEIGNRVEAIVMPDEMPQVREANRAGQVDLFNLFTGALAVQESLQLDTMRGTGRLGPEAEKRKKEIVKVASLAGPTIKSHPWAMMLGDRKPQISPLARSVPEDFCFIYFRSLNKLMDAMDLSDLWGTHLFNQAEREARTQQTGERLKKQLALETNKLLRPVYDLVVEDVAVTGSDLFLREGSDVTLLFRAKQPEVLKTRMDGFLQNARKAHKDLKETKDKVLDVPYVHLTTPDRAVHVFSAYPKPELHVRSNSKAAFERVLQAIQGGKEVKRLGESTEFAYIRTLMPEGAAEEDGFIYLSDPFIRRLVGPQLKLTERRRLLCYNHLRMIGHAALMYQTEKGQRAASLDALADANCVPGKFNSGMLTCPDGGTYTLSADGTTGICSHHGHAQNLTPCCEIPVAEINGIEADEYKQFLDRYNSYWRMYFDPIAVRLQITPQRYRAETIILPLIDNSIYTNLSMALGGKPEPLDALPVPKRNVFSIAARLHKEEATGTEVAKGNAEVIQASNNLKKIALALHNYHDTMGTFPAVANFDKNNKPLLSWRVLLLPYLEQLPLYNEFHLDEPWDSEHNKKLIERMPAVYACPGGKKFKDKTNYLAPVGKRTAFTGEAKGTRIANFTDGLSNTILVVEANDNQAVIWTKPDDLPYDPKAPAKGLGGHYEGGFLAAFADGSVHFLRNTIAREKLQALFTRDGGEVVVLEASDEQGSGVDARGLFRELLGANLDSKDVDQQKVLEFLRKGIGNQIGLHCYDAEPLFDFNLPSFLGQALGTLNGRRRGGLGEIELGISFLVAALNSPVYLSLPVQDAKVIDAFLDYLDPLLAKIARHIRERDLFGVSMDYYKLPAEKGTRAYSIRFGPLKWRFFFARIDNGLYIASKPYILDDIRAVAVDRSKSGAGEGGPVGHAMVRIRARNWQRVLTDYRLGWAENNREACLNNLGPLSSVGRAVMAASANASPAERDRQLRRLADRLHTVHFFCPEGGNYHLSADGKEVTCDVHGSALAPKQPSVPSDSTGLGKLMEELGDATATLTFMEDGLHAVVVVERK
jgi:hypothetical protein